MTEIIAILSTVFTAIVGTGGVLFYRQSKRLKIAEASAAEKAVLTKDLENQRSSNDEWIRLYNETKSELVESQNKVNDLQAKLQKATELEGHNRLLINDLTWSKCVVNECTNRKPPRDYAKKIEEIKNLHECINSPHIEKEHEDVEIDTNCQ